MKLWIVVGVLIGIILIKWMNRRERKKKLEREREQTPTPQEAYRWMPPVPPTPPQEPLKLAESSSEAQDLSKPIKPPTSNTNP